MVGVIDSQGAVGTVVKSPHLPAERTLSHVPEIAARCLQGILHPRIGLSRHIIRPAEAERVIDKGAGVHVPVAGVRLTAFQSEIAVGVGVRPVRAHEHDRHFPSAGIQIDVLRRRNDIQILYVIRAGNCHREQTDFVSGGRIAAVVEQRKLIFEQRSVVVMLCKPPHSHLRNSIRAGGVPVAVGTVAHTRHHQHPLRSLGESRRGVHSVELSEGVFKQGKDNSLIARAVAPVRIAFRIDPIRVIDCLDHSAVVLYAVVEQAAAGALLLAVNRYCGRDGAAVADLIPVAGVGVGPVAAGVDYVVVEHRLARADTEVVVEAVVEPVVAESHGEGHLGGVEEVAALVPVLEGNHGLHVRDGLLQVLRLPGHPIGVCAGAYSLESQLRLVEYALARGIQLIDNLSVVRNRLVRNVHEKLVQLVEDLVLEAVVERLFFEPVEVRPVHKHARMPHLLKGGEVRCSGGVVHVGVRLLHEALRNRVEVARFRFRLRSGSRVGVPAVIVVRLFRILNRRFRPA